MAIDPSRLEKELTSSKTSRLRLMTLLSLYDMLPHSISRPPTGQEPMDLDDAIDQETVQRILALVQAMEQSGSRPNDDDHTIQQIQRQIVGVEPPITRNDDDGSRGDSSNGLPHSRSSHDGGLSPGSERTSD
ncbi:hypothetical protein Agabi119p4_10086 [Agaricus bisporus var. burnettii]|uniref:Uncharacterized protein n=1 Tax=Agaricus bisporus var. burnettii TaxID=192524 RepID=A0A8H7EW89_AGABI|nr:hypothetical protein Agabi119p4_10086 [Agaricus bisporus var. burnettii]